jgi:hypothetical protein
MRERPAKRRIGGEAAETSPEMLTAVNRNEGAASKRERSSADDVRSSTAGHAGLERLPRERQQLFLFDLVNHPNPESRFPGRYQIAAAM